MGLIDGVVVGVISLSTVISMLRGLIRECLSLISWIGIAVLFFFSLEPLALYFIQYRMQTPLNWVVAGLVLWMVVALIARSCRTVVHALCRTLGLTWLDHVLGAFFGAARGILLAWLIVWGMILVLGPDHRLVSEASAVHYLNNNDALWQHVPSEQDVMQWCERSAPWLKDVLVKIQGSPTVDEASYSSSIPHVPAADNPDL